MTDQAPELPTYVSAEAREAAQDALADLETNNRHFDSDIYTLAQHMMAFATRPPSERPVARLPADVEAWIETIDSEKSRQVVMWRERALKAEAALTAERPEGAVAWRVDYADGNCDYTPHKHEMQRWASNGEKVVPLYAIPHEEPGRALDRDGARAAAAAIFDYADMNVTEFDAYGDGEVPAKAAEIYETAKKLRDLLSPNHSPPAQRDIGR